jgi:hypothetical protein
MNTDKANYVLQSLQEDRIDTLTKEALVKAFNDDGIYDLEGAAEHILKRVKKDFELQKIEPRLIDFSLIKKRTSPEVACSIFHAVPEVPFILDGVEYDPKDIQRFNGEALLYIPVVAADKSERLQIFHEEVGEIIAGYYQMRQLVSLINPLFNHPSLPPNNPPGTPPGQSPPPNWPPLNPPGNSGQPQPPQPPPPPPPPPARPAAPLTFGQIQMFDGGSYHGNCFWLAKGFMYRDLTRVSRGGWLGGDWNDEIFSIASTDTSCIYCEHINLEGSKLFRGPFQPIENLVPLGWHNRISSVWNFDA